MKLSKKVLREAEKLDDAQSKGGELNRKQKRILAAATKKINK